MLLSSMLTNSEVWYGMKTKHYEELEEVDQYLLRKILNCHSKTPKETLYLETGTLPIRYVIKQRRLNYFHHLLSRDKKELISKVLYAQKRKTSSNDWIETVNEDIIELSINMTEDRIAKMKKYKFKIYSKNKVKEAAFKYLQNIKEKHSKVMNINYDKFKIQPYLLESKFITTEKQLLFALRTRMTDVKVNFRSMYQNLNCDLCTDNEIQSDNHLLQCSTIIEECSQLSSDISSEYEDIFSNDVQNQMKITKLYSAVFKTKTKLELAL